MRLNAPQVVGDEDIGAQAGARVVESHLSEYGFGDCADPVRHDVYAVFGRDFESLEHSIPPWRNADRGAGRGQRDAPGCGFPAKEMIRPYAPPGNPLWIDVEAGMGGRVAIGGKS